MTTTTLTVLGMTCGHCAAAVTKELKQLDEVRDVVVELHPGQESLVVVTSEAPLPQEAVAEAIDEAGYQLAS